MTVAFSNATRLTHYPSFESWWQTQGEWVEEPNERRGGYSGVQRLTQLGQSLYAKKQTGHTYRSLLHPWGRPTVLRERDALLKALKAGVAVPEIVYCAAERNREGWRALLVTKALEGFQPLDEWYEHHAREALDASLHQQLLQQIAQSLANLHKARQQHGCMYAKHIFVRIQTANTPPSCEIALLDLEKSRRRLTRKQAALHDMLQLRRHSPWDQADWQSLINHYQLAMGRTFKTLYNATSR
ncbi:lipopolysaccharide kinase InaA family protein [Pseudomonas peli]|uniref:lipopolysaccharide kinase InaA family protein n=1 Tax=Pseudomonas peli TaxID=592361 RepID=UPI00285A5A5C|nr:lipopolysaccharide kinase InaA family protein [Pseudomonas peli]MDR7023315.1 tRNA A-37 threonylcarbamoyl transferase component Bud32 [Pseudomonas peli]